MRTPSVSVAVTGTLLQATREFLLITLDDDRMLHYLKVGSTWFVAITVKEAHYELTAILQRLEGTSAQLQMVSPPRRLDRRRNKRYPIKLKVEIFPNSPPPSEDVSGTDQSGEVPSPCEAVGVDISRTGMALLVGQPYERGDRFWVRFSLLNVEQPLVAQLEVYHCTVVGNNRWRIGARFTEMARIDAHWLARLFP